MEEKNKISISLKTFILTIVTMSLIILSLIYLIFAKTTQEESNINNTNISNVENKESENSKPEINHDSGKTYEYEENIDQKNTDDKQNNNDRNSNKANDNKLYNNEQVNSPKIFTSYTKDFVDTTEYVDELIYSENGKLFGWEERLHGACSTWCSVTEYNVDTKASSTLKPHGQYSYSSANTQNNTRENAWVEGVEGDGIGEYIEIEQACVVSSLKYKTDIGFKEICIVNGYAATEKNWNENNRVKELKMYFDNQYVTTIVLEDTIKQQFIDISKFDLKVQNGEIAKFKFEINDVYKGTKYDDTCITGLLLEFSGRTGH